MKFAITNEHRRFFKENLYIEFEEILTQKQIDQILKIFLTGSERDLWRTSTHMQSISLNKSLGSLINSLTGERKIKIVCDQILPKYLKGKTTTEDLIDRYFCYENTLCHLLICLKSLNEPTTESRLPTTPGSGLIFSPTLPLDLTKLDDGIYLLITYGTPDTRYILNDRDPHTYALKHMGYPYGAPLTEQHHPTIYP